MSNSQFINDRSVAYIYDKPLVPIHSFQDFVYHVPLPSNVDVSTDLPSTGFSTYIYRTPLDTNPQYHTTSTVSTAAGDLRLRASPAL